MASKFISVVACLVYLTFTNAESQRRPIPTPSKQNLTIGSEFTFECKDKDFPQIYFYSAFYTPTKSNTKKECRFTTLDKCTPTAVISHQCGGREQPCKLKVAPPEKAAGCTEDYVLSLMWQCTIPLPAGNPKKVFIVQEKENDPCAKYYTRQD